MGFWVKTNASTAWKTATKAWVKTNYSTAWKQAKTIWVKSASGIWQTFWPKTGPFATTSPYISTDTAGNNQPPSFDLIFGTANVYGRKGVWQANGGTISSYSYKLYSSTSSAPGSAPFTTIASGTMSGDYQSINLSNTDIDGKYIIFQVDATRTDGVVGSDNTDSNGYRYFVHKSLPTQTTAGTLSISANNLSYSGSVWNHTARYLPDATKATVDIYRNTTNSNVGGTKIATLTGVSTDNGTTYTTGFTYDLSLDTNNNSKYFYVIENQYNTGTDYYNSGSPKTSNPTSAILYQTVATPDNISITAVYEGGGYIYIFYTTGQNTDAISYYASRYDYLNGNGVQVSTSHTTSVSSSSKGYLTALYVGNLSSYSNGVPWSISATPLNQNVSGNTASDSVSAATSQYPTLSLGTASVGDGTISNSVTLNGSANYYTMKVTPSGGSTTTYIRQSGNISLSGLVNGTSYTILLTPYYYYSIDYNNDSNSVKYGGLVDYYSFTATPLATYRVTWDANGGTVTPSYSDAQQGGSVTAPTPTQSGYSFNGWYTSGGAFAVGAGGTYTPSSSITLTASWTQRPGDFTYYISDTTATPYWPSGAGINMTGTTGTASVTWNAAVNATKYIDSVRGVTGSHSYSVTGTSDTWSYSTNGDAYATVVAVNEGTQCTISWTGSSGAASYFYAYTADGVNIVSGSTTSTSITFSVPLGKTAIVYGVSSWSQPNASGIGTAGSAGSASSTPTAKSTSSAEAGPFALTVATAPAIVSGAGPAITPQTGTAGSTTYTCSTGTWTGSPTITYTYQWAYFSLSSYSYVYLAATGSTYSPPSNFNTLYYNGGLTCYVKATNSVGNSTVIANLVGVSTPTTPVAPVTPPTAPVAPVTPPTTPVAPVTPPTAPVLPTPKFSCIDQDTPIAFVMSDNKIGWKKASEIKVGDEIWSASWDGLDSEFITDPFTWRSNALNNMQMIKSVISNIIESVKDVTLVINEDLSKRFSLEQTVLLKRNEIYFFGTTGIIEVGDIVVINKDESFIEVPVFNLSLIDEERYVYEFDAAPHDILIAGDVVVHNRKAFG